MMLAKVLPPPRVGIAVDQSNCSCNRTSGWSAAGNEATGPLYLEHPKFEGFEVRQTVTAISNIRPLDSLLAF
jgi:hypothetical protein